MQKQWKKIPKGNTNLANVVNPIRNFVERTIPSIKLEQYPNRPNEKINLSIGDPTVSEQFRTHKSNLDIMTSNIGKVNGYTNTEGYDEAREALAEKFKSPGYKITKDNVFVTSGGSLAIWAVMNLLLNQGDNFIFPSPGFPLSLTMAAYMKVQPRFYRLKQNDGWKADLSEIQSLIDDRTRFIYVNDPSNPLGSVWSKQHKMEILDLCRKRNIPLLADEIYQTVTYDEPVHTFAEYSTEDITIFKCSGLTKKWLMPGQRLGWLMVYAHPDKAKIYGKGLKNMFNIFLMPNNIMQCSVKGIINNKAHDQHLQGCLKIMKKNQEVLKESLKGQKYCQFGDASGAFYATVIIKMEMFPQQKFKDVIDFAKELYAEQNIMIMPGDFFVSKVPLIRLVISCATPIIEDFVVRFKRFCNKNVKKQQ